MAATVQSLVMSVEVFEISNGGRSDDKILYRCYFVRSLRREQLNVERVYFRVKGCITQMVRNGAM